jgi:hypothetical protein
MSLIMLCGGLAVLARHGRALAACAVLAGLIAPAAAGQEAAVQAPSLRQVSYLGYTFTVPGSWPVINDADHPHGCVRFDEHAVYLGVPGADQACPSWLIGTTEALLIQPGSSSAGRSSAENPTERQITVTAPRISLVATFDADPTQIYRILASASLPAPQIVVANPARLAESSAAPEAGQGGGQAAASAGAARRRRPALSAEVANFRGRGFDSCTAPSRTYMRAWRRHSPYRAVGIYIGGADRACDQRNLSRRWVRAQARAGWRFIPMYVGPQATFGEIRSPGLQAARSAADAAAAARRLGFGRRTPIYYDMEAYPPADTGPALRFLSTWTITLHKLGYEAGVYSSSRSGIVDLARQYGRNAYTMPDVIYDALWNGTPNTRDKTFERGEWRNHQRIHQYSGNDTQTFGHDTIDIDQDFLNVALHRPGGTTQSSPAVTRPGGSVSVFFKGADSRLWRATHSARSGWARPVDMGGAVRSAPSAVSVSSGALHVFYQGTNRDLWEVSFRPGKGWAPARRLARMGVLGGPPRAVAQSGGGIDVFWRGSAHRHLWHARFSPGRGWTGPQRLGGSLSSSPSPVEASPGAIEVFWRGTNKSLWHVTSRGSGWSRPASLGMGPLGGPPLATAQASGAIEVFWKGTDQHHVWAAFGGPGGWHGPRGLGGFVSGTPWPVTAAGTVRVLWRGRGGRLWELRRKQNGGWGAPVPVRRITGLRSGPFAAAGSAGSPVEIFWRGRRGRLWSASRSGHGWTRPRSHGGRVA